MDAETYYNGDEKMIQADCATCKDCYYYWDSTCHGFETDFKWDENEKICETFSYKDGE